MKNLYGLSSNPTGKSPANQAYMGYLTQKQLSQLSKYKKDQESDRDSMISGHSNKGRRMKLRSKLSKSSNPVSQYQSPSTALMKKSMFNHNDHHYRDAIGRLKLMLADSYAPKYSSASSIFKSVTDDETDTTENTIIERPAMKEVSKFFSYKPYSTFSNVSSYRKPLTTQAPMANYSSDALLPVGNTQPPGELLNFIEKQESYIEQLEKESNFCRDELSTLLTKVKDVVSENEVLTERAKYGSEADDGYEPFQRSKFSVVSGPNILFESRISELEAQLTQMGIDYKKIADENAELKRKKAFGCDSAPDNSCSEAYKKQIENLQRDKATLEDSVKKFQKQITELKEHDAQNFSKTQRNRDLAEQSVFERTQSDIEIRRLKEELERQHERMRELQVETAKRISEERANADRRYTYQVDQLGGDLTSQWEQASKLQLEVERMKRLGSDYKRELASKMNQIEELKTEIKMKNTEHLSDLTQINAEKHSLEQELTSMRMQLERSDRQGKAEISRLNAENSSLRQRLDRSDADLLHSRRENLRLCDQISNLEKEIALGDIDRDHRPKDVKTVISEMEEKHSNTVQELENMISEQRQLMEKLTDQCKNLTQKLEDTSHQHKEDFHNLQVNVESLSKRINTASAMPVESYNYETTNNDVTDTNPDPIISSTHSSPQNSNVTYANLPQSEHTVEDNANYAISNNIKSPNSKALNRESSIKYVNEPEDEPVYNDPSYYEQPASEFQRGDSNDWNRSAASRPSDSYNSPSPSSYPNSANNGNYDQQQSYQQQPLDYGQNEYERQSSLSSSRAPSRPVSRTSSQQRIYDQDPVVSESPNEWGRERSLSRNDSQRSIVDVRKPSVTFRGDDEYEPENIQPMAEQGGAVYNNVQQYQEQPAYDQSYEQQQTYQPEYNYEGGAQQYEYEQQQQPLEPAFSPTSFALREQYVNGKYNRSEVEQQPVAYEPESPEPYQQEPEEYQPYIAPETPQRSSPPKRESPPRQQPQEDIPKALQQRQQSRDQLYGREKSESPEEVPRSPSIQSRSQPKEGSQSGQQKSPSPSAASPGATKTVRAKPGAKGGVESKESRNALGEGDRLGRKSSTVPKQPPKTVTSVRSKK